MGNWNRRYLPRKKYKNYDDEDPPHLSSSKTYDKSSYYSGAQSSRVPSWEVDYCNKMRVPWYRVVASKKYIYCYPSVQNWDDSACKEAFENAKQRYWAMINNVPCDNPLPDKDTYIDEIDWNSYVDPELMEDLDRQFFNPDDVQNVNKLEPVNEEVGCAQLQDDKKQPVTDNPWEMNQVQGPDRIKDAAQGWGRWDDSVNYNNDNPWEQSGNQHVDSVNFNNGNSWEQSGNQHVDSVNLNNGNPWEQSGNQHAVSWKANTWEQSGNQHGDSWKANAWGSGKESWGWRQGVDYNNRASAVRDYRSDKSGNYGSQNVGVGQGWGQRGAGSWGSSQRDAKGQNSSMSANGWNSWENDYLTGSREGCWNDNGKGFWGRKGSQFQVGDSNCWDSGRFSRGGSSFRGGCRKRESPLQHTSKYKSTRYQG